MTANGKASPATVSALFKRPDPLPRDYGEHEGHQVCPHSHDWQDDRDGKYAAMGRWCSARFFCATCTQDGGKIPGTWFWGPPCERPVKVKAS